MADPAVEGFLEAQSIGHSVPLWQCTPHSLEGMTWGENTLSTNVSIEEAASYNKTTCITKWVLEYKWHMFASEQIRIILKTGKVQTWLATVWEAE